MYLFVVIDSDSSSSDESTDEEFDDEDNDDFVPIKLDENVCPEGCDPAIFEEVINHRNLRYTHINVLFFSSHGFKKNQN